MVRLDEAIVGGSLSTQTQGATLQDSVVIDRSKLTGESLGFLVETALNPQIEIKARQNSDDATNILDFALPEAHTLDISGGAFDPVLAKGINSQQPEILALFDFEPAFSDQGELPLGKLLKIQIDALKIKSQNINDLIAKLKENSQTKPLIERIEARQTEELNKINEDINFLRNLLFNLTKIKDAFLIKGNEIKIAQEISRIRNITDLSQIRTPKDILIQSLGFSNEGYINFLNSKIIAQLLKDLMVSILEYSPTLFVGSLNREIDINPINIIESHNLTAGRFQFRVGSLTGIRSGVSNIVDWVDNDNLSSKLPGEPEDKIVLLTLLASKEFSVSAGLTSSGNILENFGNPPKSKLAFFSVFGDMGDTVLSKVFGENSVASNLRTEDTNGNVILPFEKKFIDENNKTYIPGTLFYVDNIIKNRENILNTEPLNNFSRRFNAIVSDAKRLLDRTITLDGVEDESVKNTLTPKGFITKILNSILSLVKINAPWVSAENAYVPLTQFSINLAILNEMISDIEFKKLYFQLVLIRGLELHFRNENGFYKELLDGGLNTEEINTRFGTRDSLTLEGTVRNIIKKIKTKIEEKVGLESARLVESDFQRNFLRADTIITEISKLLKTFDETSKILATTEVLFSENNASTSTYFKENAQTKFNSINGIHLTWIIFEIYTSILNELFSSQLKNPFRDNTLAETDLVELTASINALKLFFNEEDIEFNRTELVSEKLGFINRILNRVDGQTKLIKDIMNIFLAINRRIKTSKEEMLNLFSNNQEIINKIETIRNEEGGQEKLFSLSSSQISISQAMFEDFNSSRENLSSPFLDQTELLPKQKAIFFDLLNLDKFKIKKAFNAKIISIGLGAGFLESLQTRLDRFIVGKSLSVFEEEEGKEKDIIKINIYKQDLEFEDIIFKPIPFIFELSRFVTKDSFDINSNNIFDIKSKNFTFDGAHPRIETLRNVLNNDAYSFLTTQQKEQMFENHLINHFLEIYLKLLTGAKLNEKEFYLNDGVFETLSDDELIDQINQLINVHISSIADRKLTLEELKRKNENVGRLIERIGNNEITSGIIEQLKVSVEDIGKSKSLEIGEDLKNFLRIFSHRSILFGAGEMRRKITSPKMFERIFNILIDPDDFEIDVNKTLATESGKQLLDFSLNQNKIESSENDAGQRTLKFKERNLNENSSEFLRFFVTVEQLPEQIKEADLEPPPQSTAPEQTVVLQAGVALGVEPEQTTGQPELEGGRLLGPGF